MVTVSSARDLAFYNEWQDSEGNLRSHYAGLACAMESIGTGNLAPRFAEAAKRVDLDSVTFYLDPGKYRNMPTDFVPRVIPLEHWENIAAGVEQRLRSINRFLVDLYAGQQDIVPDDIIYSSQHFYPEVQGFRPPRDVFVHIYGIDLVHLGDGRYVVLEDNLRIPSGISYQMKSRQMIEEMFPEFAREYDILPYEIRDAYANMFRSLVGPPFDPGPGGGALQAAPPNPSSGGGALQAAPPVPSPGGGALHENQDPFVVLLTDGKYGSAFFEHRYLSEELDIPLVEGPDLYVGPDGFVYVRTLDHDVRVDVIYRRVEDLDLFVPGLGEAYLNGKVVLVNGIGTGAADDKLVFLWVPQMIERYLGQTPILERATSYNPADPERRRFMLENLENLVIKTRQGYGGLGVFVMPDLGEGYKARVANNILQNPLAFIAQETLDFSQHMVFNEHTCALEPHHVDLRVFAVQSGDGTVSVFPGGLTRVAQAGSRITNNSSGGLCKPTWVVR